LTDAQLQRGIDVTDRDAKSQDVDWLTDALAADWNPRFVREFRAWAEKQDNDQPLMAEVWRAWLRSWAVH
jgi:hypothetical protein